MQKKHIFLLLIACAQLLTNGQAKFRIFNCDSAIYSGRYMGGKLMTRRYCAQRFSKYSSSAGEFASYKTDHYVFSISLISTFSALTVGGIAYGLYHGRPNGITTVCGLTVLGGLTATYIFNGRSVKHYKRCLDNYNREVCSKPW